MTVKELITRLESYNPECTVVVEAILENHTVAHVTPSVLFSYTYGVVIFPDEFTKRV